MSLGLPEGASGVFPHQWISKAIDANVVRAPATNPIPTSNIQPASLDLRLGPKAHRLRCSFLPDRETVSKKLSDYADPSADIDLRAGAILEPNRPYLVPLVESLALPAGVRAKANPKSSTGRLDVFTRVIADNSYLFDEIPAGYRGRLYLEIVSRTFAIFVREGLSLNQLRLAVGDTRVSDEEIVERHAERRMLFADHGAIPEHRLTLGNGLFLSLDLRGDEQGLVGYRAKRNSGVVDLAKRGHYETEDFWDPVFRERQGPRVVLDPEEFYLLLSAEAVAIPPDLAAEMSAFAETSGELRTHYAGFFDPGFGYESSGLKGSRAALEVRAHDVPFMVEQQQQVCRLTFERMLEEPTLLYGQDIGSHYQAQGVMLSKHFRVTRQVRTAQPSLWRDVASES